MVRMVDRRNLRDVDLLALGVLGDLMDLAGTQRHARAMKDVAREHRADAKREAGNRAYEREHDAAHRDAAEQGRLLRQEVSRQREDWRDLGMHRTHVDADHRARQADRQADERRRKGRDGRRARVRRGEDGLDVRLRAEHADDDGREVREDMAHVAVQQVEGASWQSRGDGGVCKQRMRRHSAGDGHRNPDDDHLEDAADAGTLHAAEEGVGCDSQHEQDRRGQEGDAEDRGDDVDGRQAARHGAEQDADGRDDAREDAAGQAEVLREELRDRLKRRAAQGLGVEKAHDDEADARADGEPPGREAGRRRKLCRTNGRAAADTRARDAARDERHAGRAPADAEALRRVDRARSPDAEAQDDRNRRADDDELKQRNIH